MRCISQRRRRGETSCRGSLTDHLQVVKLGVVEVEVNIPRFVEHSKEDKRLKCIGSHVRIPNFAGDDELAVLLCSSVVDRLEDLGAHIFGEVKQRIKQVWPEVVDDQHEAQVIGLIYSMERKLKGCLHLDGATEIVDRVPSVVLG